VSPIKEKRDLKHSILCGLETQLEALGKTLLNMLLGK